MPSLKISEAVVQEALRVALRQTLGDAGDLLADHAHERSIMFHVGRHLAPAVSTWSDQLRVDVEYNRRVLPMVGEHVAKILSWHPGDSLSIPRLVLPDLVVHDPSSFESNVLVIEAKVRASQRSRQLDCAKLAAYRDVLLYQHAVYLEFRDEGTPPSWFWVDDQWSWRPQQSLRTVPVW